MSVYLYKRDGMRNIRKIECKICNKSYSIVGIATHLKDTHKITVNEYTSVYEEYRPKYIDYKERAIQNDITCKICNNKFASEKHLSHHLRHHAITKKDYVLKYFLSGILPKCACGCDQYTSILKQAPYYRKYKSGHNPNGMKGKIHSDDVRVKMSKKAIDRFSNINTAKYDTNPELKFKNFLDNNEIDYITQMATEYGCVDFYLPDIGLFVEIDGEYWHPTEYKDLNFQLLSSAVGDKRKSNLPNLIRIRESDLDELEHITDLHKLNYKYNFDIEYNQRIISKSYLQQKDTSKYTALMLKFLREFSPEFPYPTTTETIKDVLDYIAVTDISNVKTGDVFSNHKCYSIGCKYLKSHFKSYWHSKYNGNESPTEIWHNDAKMRKIIEYRTGHNTSNEIFDFSLHQMLRGISAIRGTISFFKPVLAAAIYHHFLGDKLSPIVIDTCAGFGGRMLGFKAKYPGGKYIGIEPNPDTYKELKELSKHFDNIELHNCKLEEYSGTRECDLTFTSIPYYDKEIYSTHMTYDSISEWTDTFIKELLLYKNLVVNVPYELRYLFPTNAKEYFLQNNTSHLNKTNTCKFEYILDIDNC